MSPATSTLIVSPSTTSMTCASVNRASVGVGATVGAAGSVGAGLGDGAGVAVGRTAIAVGLLTGAAVGASVTGAGVRPVLGVTALRSLPAPAAGRTVPRPASACTCLARASSCVPLSDVIARPTTDLQSACPHQLPKPLIPMQDRRKSRSFLAQALCPGPWARVVRPADMTAPLRITISRLVLNRNPSGGHSCPRQRLQSLSRLLAPRPPI